MVVWWQVLSVSGFARSVGIFGAVEQRERGYGNDRLLVTPGEWRVSGKCHECEQGTTSALHHERIFQKNTALTCA
jgi:hypothetical protein